MNFSFGKFFGKQFSKSYTFAFKKKWVNHLVFTVVIFLVFYFLIFKKNLLPALFWTAISYLSQQIQSVIRSY